MVPHKGWEMFFDEVSRSPIGARKEDVRDTIAGIRILFVSTVKHLSPILFPLQRGAPIIRLNMKLSLPDSSWL